MNQQTQSHTETVDLWSFIEGAIGFLSDVQCGKTHLIITHAGKPLAAIVPLEDLQQLQHNNEKKGT